MAPGKEKEERGAARSKTAGQRCELPCKALAGASGGSATSLASGAPGNANSIVIPLSQDKSQRSLFSLTKVVRLGKAHTAVSFTAEDLQSCRMKLEEATTGKFELLGVLRRLGCYRLCMEDVRSSGLGGIVRVLSLVHPKDEVREAAGRLLGRWKRVILREIFPLPRRVEKEGLHEQKDAGCVTGGVATQSGVEREETREERGESGERGERGEREEREMGDEEKGYKSSVEHPEEEATGEEQEETYGYDVEAARNAPEGTEVAPDEMIRMEEEEAAYERMMERKMRVEADPLCSSSSDEEEGYSESDMWSPGMDRKRRARERARAQSKKNQESKRSKKGTDVSNGTDGVDGTEGADEEPSGETAATRRAEKPRLSRAFMNLFAGGKKKNESMEGADVGKSTEGASAGDESKDKSGRVVVELTDSHT